MSIRTNSRKAHPLAWAQLTRFRRLRCLTQQALRAKDRGDKPTMFRLAQLLKRMTSEDIFQDEVATVPATAPALFQKGVSGIKKIFRRGGDR